MAKSQTSKRDEEHELTRRALMKWSLAAGAALGAAVSRARLHFVSRLFSNPGHARLTGSDAAGVDWEARHTARRRNG